MPAAGMIRQEAPLGRVSRAATADRSGPRRSSRPRGTVRRSVKVDRRVCATATSPHLLRTLGWCLGKHERVKDVSATRARRRLLVVLWATVIVPT